jgi:hypothetical protein
VQSASFSASDFALREQSQRSWINLRIMSHIALIDVNDCLDIRDIFHIEQLVYLIVRAGPENSVSRRVK